MAGSRTQSLRGRTTNLPPTTRDAGLSELTPVLVLTVLYAVAAAGVIARFPDTTQSAFGTVTTYLGYAVRNGSVTLMLVLLAAVGWLAIRNPDASFKDLLVARWARYRPGLPVLGLRAGIGFASFALFTFAYAAIKVRMTEWAPFTWDEAFFAWDRALFAGRDPWTLFAWLYEAPIALKALDLVYDVWAGLLVAAWVAAFVVSRGDASVRLRFPVALVLCWAVGGNLLASVLSSAGPVYFEAVTGLPSPYAAQLEALSQFSLRANDYQALLWGVHSAPGYGVGGISAMPSMHCATATLFVCAAWHRPGLRLAALGFLAVILIGSFVLAWHYAVDGLLAIPVAVLSWVAAARLLKWSPK